MDCINVPSISNHSRLAGFHAAILAAALLFPATSGATWVAGGVAVSATTGEQSGPRVAPDGFGGAIITWMDKRNGTDFDIYAQRLSADGVPQWNVDGVPIATGASLQRFPFIASDNAGGAVITWKDDRNGPLDIYAQRVGPDGQTLWTPNGVPVCTEAGQQQDTEIVAHGDGTVIILWRDWRVGGSAKLYAQRLSAAGQPMWTLNGVQIASVPNQYHVSMLQAGDGSYFLAWYDWRSGNFDVYAQRLNADGSLSWAANGAPVCTSTGDQILPKLASDGAGGVILTWYDGRSGGYDIYAQRLTGTGNVAPGWPLNGVPLCVASNDQFEPVIVPDGQHGAIVTWYDNRGTVAIYAQHVLASGLADPAWPVNGKKLNTAPSTRPAIFSNGSGGAIVAWQGTPGHTNLDVVAQCITAGGSFESGWPTDGIMVCTEPGDQSRPVGIELGAGDALIVWSDARSDIGDVYAQRIAAAFPNLNVATVPGSFSHPAVPRNEAGASLNNAVLTPILDGDEPNTSLNWAVQVEGAGSGLAWSARLLLDGEPVSTMSIGAGSPAGSYQTLNDGPISVRGGRHTLTVEADPSGQVPESSESDNSWSGQFVWSPVALTAGAGLLRPAPPEPGTGPEPNSDGFSFAPAAGKVWSVALAPVKPGDDYDLRVYSDYAGSTTGFSNRTAASSGTGNRTEFVIGAGTTSTVLPAAIRGASAADNEECAVDAIDASGRVGSQSVEEWAGQVMPAYRLVDVYEGHFTAGQVYHMTLSKFIGGTNMEFAIFPPDGGVYNRDQSLVTSINLTPDGTDVDVFTFAAPATGTYPIAVYRTTGDALKEDLHYHFFWSTSVSGVAEGAKEGVTFEGASPNPMTFETRLAFSLPEIAAADLSIFDVNGRLVRRLVQGEQSPGRSEVAWDGTADDGRRVPAGLYWTRFSALGRIETNRINVIR